MDVKSLTPIVTIISHIKFSTGYIVTLRKTWLAKKTIENFYNNWE